MKGLFQCPHMEKKTITREQCLELNEMAERIAEWR